VTSPIHASITSPDSPEDDSSRCFASLALTLVGVGVVVVVEKSFVVTVIVLVLLTGIGSRGVYKVV
jgi:hypothetical protein